MTSTESRATYYLHVGLPKTGTTYLQSQLRAHRDALSEAGVLYPRMGKRGRFLAALDGRDLHTYAGVNRSAEGHWARFVESTCDFPGRVVFSHEVMGAPDGTAAPTALRLLEDHDVHIVVTVRDAARQLASAWQQGLRHKSARTFEDFIERARLDPLDTYRRGAFGNQHVDSVLQAWAQHVPADRIHVVTVPAPGASSDVLWERFCTVLGVDPAQFPVYQEARSNPSLGIVQLEHLRRINEAVGERLTNEARVAHVRGFLVSEVLAKTAPSARPVLPPGSRDAAASLAERWIDAVEKGGYDVVGDLDDLWPADVEGREPAAWTADELIDVGAEASAELLIAYSETRRELEQARAALKKRRAPQREEASGGLRNAAGKVRRRLGSQSGPGTTLRTQDG
ncbi:MAG: hypothetical protein ACRDO7_05010 [Nocardioidaceae bacterium]